MQRLLLYAVGEMMNSGTGINLMRRLWRTHIGIVNEIVGILRVGKEMKREKGGVTVGIEAGMMIGHPGVGGDNIVNINDGFVAESCLCRSIQSKLYHFYLFGFVSWPCSNMHP